MVWSLTRKWGKFSGIGKGSPHDLRSTAITRVLDKELTYRQVQRLAGMTQRPCCATINIVKNLDQNAINFLDYDENSK